MEVIDVHTHMLSRWFLDRLRSHGAPVYDVKPNRAGEESVHRHGVPFLTVMPEMCDYDARIRDMDAAGVDLAIVSLTTPSAFFGDADVSSEVARVMNDGMAEQQALRPDRIRWFATLPWQYPEHATAELKRALGVGAAGVFVTANIDGRNLTDPLFAPVWRAIDDQALPVLVHPTAPQGLEAMDLDQYGLVPPIGFTFDTTLAIARMILDGFIDRHPRLKIIAAHGGGALPYLAGRLDRCHERIKACAEVITEKPSEYLRRIYYDAVVYSPDALGLCIKVAGDDRVMYGSDYPHNIGDMRGCLERSNGLPRRLAMRVNSDNARRIFNL